MEIPNVISSNGPSASAELQLCAGSIHYFRAGAGSLCAPRRHRTRLLNETATTNRKTFMNCDCEVLINWGRTRGFFRRGDPGGERTGGCWWLEREKVPALIISAHRCCLYLPCSATGWASRKDAPFGVRQKVQASVCFRPTGTASQPFIFSTDTTPTTVRPNVAGGCARNLI